MCTICPVTLYHLLFTRISHISYLKEETLWQLVATVVINELLWPMQPWLRSLVCRKFILRFGVIISSSRTIVLHTGDGLFKVLNFYAMVIIHIPSFEINPLDSIEGLDAGSL